MFKIVNFLISLKNILKTEEKKEDLKNYELEKWQEELVKEGKQEPWSFEEEDLEEDDYYSEDE